MPAERASELAARRQPLEAASAVEAEPRLQPRYAEVVLPIPVPRTYTYQIPAELAGRVVPGARVVVPLQRRRVVGLVVGVDAPPPWSRGGGEGHRRGARRRAGARARAARAWSLDQPLLRHARGVGLARAPAGRAVERRASGGAR